MGTKATLEPASTKEKIKQAAQEIFLKKGYSATRTRDIADASGENLALISYYFRNKENLYRIIMMETMGAFLNTMVPVLNNENTALEEKMELLISNYIDLFTQRPEIPLFVLTELNNNSEHFLEKTSIQKIMMGSNFFQQLQQRLKENKNEISPLHIFMNMMSMIIFPFIASPLIKGLHDMKNEEFNQLIQERKKLIPIWMNKLLDV